MSTFVGALPASVTPMACGTVNVSDQVFATTPLVVYPNPANDVTFLNFGLATETRVRISVINLVGEEVILLTEGRLSAGEHRFNLNLENLANGVYMIRMQANDKTTTQRLVVQ
jgi:hypothetical protein